MSFPALPTLKHFPGVGKSPILRILNITFVIICNTVSVGDYMPNTWVLCKVPCSHGHITDPPSGCVIPVMVVNLAQSEAAKSMVQWLNPYVSLKPPSFFTVILLY